MDVRTEPMTEDLCPFHLVPFRQFRGLSIDNQHHAEFYRCRASSLPRRLFFSDLRRPSSPPGSPRHYLSVYKHLYPDDTPAMTYVKRASYRTETLALTYEIVDEPVGRWTHSMFGTIVKPARMICLLNQSPISTTDRPHLRSGGEVASCHT